MEFNKSNIITYISGACAIFTLLGGIAHFALILPSKFDAIDDEIDAINTRLAVIENNDSDEESDINKNNQRIDNLETSMINKGSR